MNSSAHTKKSKGLLGRALSFDDKKKSTQKDQTASTSASNRSGSPTLSQTLTNLPSGLQFPGHFLSILMKQFGFSKCGLFFNDANEDFFIPAVLYGFDITTENRLRMPGNLFDNTSLDQVFIRINAQLKKRLQPFFSTRESGLFEKGFIILFQKAGEFHGALLVSEENWTPKEKDYKEIAVLCRRYQEKLLQFRPLISGSSVEKKELFNTKTEIETIFKMQAETGNSLRFLFVGIDPIISFLKERKEYSSGLLTDINQILRSMCVSNENFIKISPTKSLLILKGKLATTRKDLVLHQINISLASFFKNPDNFPHFQWEIRDYPADGEDFKSLLKPFLM